ncbi:hypothetical protein UMC2_23721 [[Clostridium] sordellii]|nr:hypothetical protein UMC2_23721 [[Clostridium] sordellii] [Paeniclostridium sordellii]
MITKFSKWILFISSYIPLYIIFIVSNIFDIFYNYQKLGGMKKNNIWTLIRITKNNIILIIIFFTIIVLAFIMINIMIRRCSNNSYFEDFRNIQKNNKSINDYVLVYILPFISIQSNDFKQLTIFIMVFSIIGIVSVKNDLVYINPILYFMKYNIYTFQNDNINESNILITKFTILELKSMAKIKENECISIRASKISDNVYLIGKIYGNN